MAKSAPAKPASKTADTPTLTAAQQKTLTAMVAQLGSDHAAMLDGQAPGGRAGWDPDAVVAKVLADSKLQTDSVGAFRSGCRAIRHRNFKQVKDRSVWTNRSPVWPWLIAALVFAAGSLGWLIGAGTGASALVGYAAPLLLGLVAVGAGAVYRKKLAGLVPAGWWPWLIGAAVDAVVWIGWVTAEGYSGLRLSWLLVSTVVFGMRYWARVRPAYPTGPRAATPDDTSAAAEMTHRFYGHLACPGGPLAGAGLTDLRPYANGLEGLLRLVPGKQSLNMVKAMMPVICTALGYYADEIVIEHHRDRRPYELLIRVVTRSPITQTVFFTEPVYKDGRILLGPYADGIGNAVFTLYTEDSMECGFILGSKGSGKSRVIEIIALTAIAHTPTVIVYIDGQNGASSSLLWKHAHWRGKAAQAPQILASLMEIKDYRQDYNVEHDPPLDGFTPTQAMPGILIIVDESHKIFTQDPDGWAELSRECRKVGMGILAASQDVTLKAFGGAAGPSDVLRSSLISSNGIALRTASAVQQQVFPGLDVDLAGLPKKPGYGYTVDEGDEDSDARGARTAPFRARHLVKAGKLADLYAEDATRPKNKRTVPAGLRTAEDWYAELADRQVLDEGSADAAGEIYDNRHAQAEADRDALRERMRNRRTRAQARRNGTSATTAPTPVPAVTVAQPPRTGWVGIKIPTIPTFTPATPRPSAPAAGLGRLTPAQTKILAAITTGADTPSQIADTVEISRQAVHKHLAALTTAGHLTTAERGRYVLTAGTARQYLQ